MSQNQAEQKTSSTGKKKQSKQAPINNETKRLAKALKFTAKDLHYNRHGVVSKEQFKRISNDIGLGLILFPIVFIITSIIGIFTIPMFLRGQLNLIPDSFKGWFLTLILIGIFGVLVPIGSLYMVIRIMLSMNALRKGNAQRCEGAIRKEVQTTNYRGHITHRFFLHVGSIKYEVREDEFKQFRDGALYIVYYVPHYTHYLSVEAIDPAFELNLG